MKKLLFDVIKKEPIFKIDASCYNISTKTWTDSINGMQARFLGGRFPTVTDKGMLFEDTKFIFDLAPLNLCEQKGFTLVARLTPSQLDSYTRTTVAICNDPGSLRGSTHFDIAHGEYNPFIRCYDINGKDQGSGFGDGDIVKVGKPCELIISIKKGTIRWYYNGKGTYKLDPEGSHNTQNICKFLTNGARKSAFCFYESIKIYDFFMNNYIKL